MTVLYEKNDVFDLEKKIKKEIIAVISIFLAAIVFFIFAVVLANEDNGFAFKIVAISVTVALGFVALTIVFLKLIPDSRRRLLLIKILNGRKSHVSGRVLNITEVTTADKVRVYEIELQSGEDKLFIYLEHSLGKTLAKGEEIKAEVSANYFYSIDNEKKLIFPESKKKFDFLSYFSKSWYTYIVWLVVVLFACEFAFSVAMRPKKETTVQVFAAVYGCKSQDLTKSLEAIVPEYVKTINVYDVSPDDIVYYAVYSARGKFQGDIIILPESKLGDENIAMDFLILDETLIERYFGGVECYRFSNGKAYGIKLYDADSNIGASEKYFTYYTEKKKENYYLFFNKNSLHLGEFTGATENGAIVIAQAIFKTKV